MTTTETRISVTAFDSLSSVAAGAVLEPVCGSSAWVVALVASRPHRTLDMLRTRSDEAIAAMEWPDVEQALGAQVRPDADVDRSRVREQLAATTRRRLGEVIEDVDPPAVAPMWIALDGAENVRDVGGLPTAEGGIVKPGALLRSDSLQELSEADVRRLVDDLRLTAVADLRTTVEVDAEGPGPLTREEQVDVVHLSLFPEAGEKTDAAATDGSVVLPWQDNNDRRRGAGAVYLGYLEDRADSVLAALRLVAHSPGAALVHCAAGKDRTGTVVALALSEVGVERDAIVDDYVRSGERIERIFARLGRRNTYANDISGKAADADKHRPRASTMRQLLDGIDEKYGGVPAWLRAHGWTDEDASALRAKLIDS